MVFWKVFRVEDAADAIDRSTVGIIIKSGTYKAFKGQFELLYTAMMTSELFFFSFPKIERLLFFYCYYYVNVGGVGGGRGRKERKKPKRCIENRVITFEKRNRFALFLFLSLLRLFERKYLKKEEGRNINSPFHADVWPSERASAWKSYETAIIHYVFLYFNVFFI